MKCPFCGVEQALSELHRHLVADHAGEVRTEELAGRMAYAVTCPYCLQRYRQPIRKSAGDPEFVAEFERQIRLVAFDMLVHHLVAEHDSERAEP